jgi:hypothetical protein
VEEILLQAKPYLEVVGFKFEWFKSIVLFMGSARFVSKPIMTSIERYVSETENTKDDELLEKVKSSKYYKWAAFAIDYVASIKLPKAKEEPKQ